MPTYHPELDDGPHEVRRGYANNVISFWPKVPGEGNVVANEDTPPTFSIFKPDGTTILTGQSVTITARGVGDTYSEIVCAIDASNESTYELGDGYRIDIKWRWDDEPSREYLSTVRFDVVREPYVPGLSINDFFDEFPDARQFLEGQAEAMDDQRTADQHASVLGFRAWKEVNIKIKKRVRAEKKVYARLLIEREKVEHIVIAKALEILFRGEGGGGPALEHEKKWKEIADQRFADLGELEYDSDDDGVEDEIVRRPVSVRVERRW